MGSQAIGTYGSCEIFEGVQFVERGVSAVDFGFAVHAFLVALQGGERGQGAVLDESQHAAKQAAQRRQSQVRHSHLVGPPSEVRQVAGVHFEGRADVAGEPGEGEVFEGPLEPPL